MFKRIIKLGLMSYTLSFVIQLIIILVSNNILYSNLENKTQAQIKIENDLQITQKYISFNSKLGHTKVKCYYYFPIEKTEQEISELIKENKISYNYLYDVEIMDYSYIQNKYKNPNSFNYKRYMFFNHEQISITVGNVKTATQKYNPIDMVLDSRMKMINLNITRYEKASYINALVFGYNNIDKQMYDIYSNLSIVHVFAISGTHVIIIIGILRYILSILKIPQKKIDNIVIAFLLLYIILTAASFSILRASMMYMLRIKFKDRLSNNQIYLIVLWINVMVNPFAIFLTGFKLSYLITFMLINLSKEFNKPKNIICRSLYLQLLINLTIFPIINHLNYSINLSSYILNIVVVPIIAFVLFPVSILLTIVNISVLVNVYNVMINSIESICIFLDRFTYICGNMNRYLSVVYYLIYILFLYKYIVYKVLDKKIIKLLIGIIIIVIVNINILGSVNIVDVGQGDCIYIKLPLNKGNILIDTGTQYSEDEVTDFLKYNAVNKIDAIFLTHYHQDHFGGYTKVSNSFKVNNVIVPKTYEDMITAKNDYVIYTEQKDVVKIKGYDFHIYEPNGLYSEDENENSLVIQVKLGKKVWLFTGDTQEKQELELTQKYCDDLESDYLKVAHHGSKTSSSSEFIGCVNPDEAFISVGEGNMYNHPSKEVIDRFEQAGVSVIQTKDEGLIRRLYI